MQSIIKSAALIIAVCAFSVFVVSCGKKNKNVDESATQLTMATDMLGRDVQVPQRPRRVITDRILPFPAAWYVAVRSDMREVVAMHSASKSAAVNSMLNIMAPAVSKAAVDIFNGNTPNIEAVMALQPDLVFAFADEAGLIDPYVTAGITALGIRAASAAGGDVLATLGGWFDVLAFTGGGKEATDAIVAEGEAARQMIARQLEAAGEANPSAVIIFSTNAGNIEIAGGNFFSEYWLKNTGAADPAAASFNGRKVVNMEQLYAWNPDIIYLTNFTPLQPDDLLHNRTGGHDWSQIAAVQNGRVHKIPLGIYRWFPPSGDAPLMFKWMAQKNHPSVFRYAIESEIKDFYERHYHYKLSDKEVSFILNPDKAAAAGYTL